MHRAWTEADWIECQDAPMMLFGLIRTSSQRKLRLVAAACCRRYCDSFSAENQEKLASVESCADGLITWEECADVGPTSIIWCGRPSIGALSCAVECKDAWDAALMACMSAKDGYIQEDKQFDWSDALRAQEKEAQAILLRHIFGNPFRPRSPPAFVPVSIRRLGESVYQQNASAVGPLHDALLDAGLTDLAAHFQDAAEWHPKGCWAIDLLTGRK
jgi:hypothetical protein